MTLRNRLIAAGVVAVIHVVALAPLIGEHSSPLRGFQADAEAILDGALPYADRGFEYPPLSLPLVLIPGLVSDAETSYNAAFGWEMLAFDLAIVLLLALALGGDRRRIWGALGVYSLGVILLSEAGPLPSSDIEVQPLALARFDLAPAALILAAALARQASRSATWSALLAAGVAIKAFPLLLYPSLLRGERQLRRVAIAAAIPLALAAGIVLVTGDEFASAIGYHTDRNLQIETLGATPFLLAHLFGAGASTEFSAGAYNLVADGAGTMRTLSILALIAAYALVVREGWRRRTPPLQIATAVLAVMVLLSPVLSPQFLFWVLPVSAAAYGLRVQNLLLVAAILLTQVMLSLYSGVGGLSDSFILALAARNAVLVAFVAAVLVDLFRAPRPEPEPVAEPAPA